MASTDEFHLPKADSAGIRDTKSLYDESDYFARHRKTFENPDSSFQRYRIRKVLEIYTPEQSDVVLDLGSGWGTFSFALAPHVRNITGVDFSTRSIDLCRDIARKRGLVNVSFVLADAQNTGLPDSTFDVVICADLVEHLYPDKFRGMLREVCRLLVYGGRLVIWTPHRGHLFEILKNRNILLKKDSTHVDYKSMRFLVIELRKASFNILKAYYAESHVPVVAVIENKFMRWIPPLRRRIAILAQKA